MQNKPKLLLERIAILIGLLLILVITSVTSIYFTKHPLLSGLKVATSDQKSSSLSRTLLAVQPANKTVDLANIDLANIERHDVANPRATVVYIPQLHKEPTTAPEDPRNDQAVVVQKEISTMIADVVKKNGVTYVMDETDLYGPMPSDKMAKLQTGVASINQFNNDLEKVLSRYIKDGGSPVTANAIRQQAATQIAQVERRMYLTGGAPVAAAKDPAIHAYGSQNKASIDEARAELTNVLYMEKRIAQLEGSSSATTTAAPASGTSNSILALLQRSGQSVANPLTQVMSFASQQNDSQLLSDSKKAAAQLQPLLSQKDFETAGNNQITPPADPYANRTDLANLKNEYNVYKAKFMQLAKDQRSQEAADNVDRMMTENNQKAAILVYGVGHKDEIVAALNKKGISVIVATPTSEPANIAQG